jgi:hypothetical protein
MQRWCKQDSQRSRSLNKLQRWCRIWIKSKRKSLSKCLKYRLKPKTSKSLDLLRRWLNSNKMLRLMMLFRSLVELKKPTCKVSTTLRRSLNSPNSKRQRTIVYTMTTSVMLNKRQSRRSRFQMPKIGYIKTDVGLLKVAFLDTLDLWHLKRPQAWWAWLVVIRARGRRRRINRGGQLSPGRT